MVLNNKQDLTADSQQFTNGVNTLIGSSFNPFNFVKNMRVATMNAKNYSESAYISRSVSKVELPKEFSTKERIVGSVELVADGVDISGLSFGVFAVEYTEQELIEYSGQDLFMNNMYEHIQNLGLTNMVTDIYNELKNETDFDIVILALHPTVGAKDNSWFLGYKVMRGVVTRYDGKTYTTPFHGVLCGGRSLFIQQRVELKSLSVESAMNLIVNARGAKLGISV